LGSFPNILLPGPCEPGKPKGGKTMDVDKQVRDFGRIWDMEEDIDEEGNKAEVDFY